MRTRSVSPRLKRWESKRFKIMSNGILSFFLTWQQSFERTLSLWLAFAPYHSSWIIQLSLFSYIFFCACSSVVPFKALYIIRLDSLLYSSDPNKRPKTRGCDMIINPFFTTQWIARVHYYPWVLPWRMQSFLLSLCKLFKFSLPSQGEEGVKELLSSSQLLRSDLSLNISFKFENFNFYVIEFKRRESIVAFCFFLCA